MEVIEGRTEMCKYKGEKRMFIEFTWSTGKLCEFRKPDP
uniref:Uncharacterized protein n=1 Tax=Anguilla anguilla TaxID=7936 RepID=A0A0E9SGW4_ANGAN